MDAHSWHLLIAIQTDTVVLFTGLFRRYVRLMDSFQFLTDYMLIPFEKIVVIRQIGSASVEKTSNIVSSLSALFFVLIPFILGEYSF